MIVTHGFLRSLARLDLAESRVGRYADLSELPDPPPRHRFKRPGGDRTSPTPSRPRTAATARAPSPTARLASRR